MIETTDFLPGGGMENIGNADEPWKEIHAERIYGEIQGEISEAKQAIQDKNGNDISETYATKVELNTLSERVRDIEEGSGTGGSDSFSPTIIAKAVPGRDVTFSSDTVNETITADENGEAKFVVSDFGVYYVTATLASGKEKTEVVDVSAVSVFTVNLRSTIYGYCIDEKDIIESTCVYPVPRSANYGFKPIRMNFTSNVDNNTLDWGDWKDSWIMPKPCMLLHNGTVAYYLNPDDYTIKEDGSTSDVKNTAFEGEAMMEWPCIFRKVERKDGFLYHYFSDYKEDDDYECYSCLKEDGTYAEHFYTPIYEGSVISGKMRSLSTGAKPTSSTTMANEMAYARALGGGWDITSWADEDLIMSLGPLVLGRLNVEQAIGFPCAYNTNATALTHVCGTADKKGMFFGHSTTSKYATKFFGMENWWGHRWRRCTGLLTNDYSVFVKMTKHTGDGSTVSDYSNSEVTGYIDTGVKVPAGMSQSYITKMAGNKLADFVPIAVGGSSTTNYCDAGWSAAGLRAPLLGGYVNFGSLGGLFAFAVADAPSHASWAVGASLSYRAL